MTTVNLEKIKSRYISARKDVNRRIIVCAGTGCLANGSEKVFDLLVRLQKDRNIRVDIKLKPEENP